MRVLILLFGLLALTACSQKSAKVKLELTSSFAFGGSAAMQAVSEGGLMVWGKSAQGDHFARVLSDTDSVDLEIPNGQWTFSAMAWDSTTNTPMDTDAVRCARSASTDLKGETAAVPLVLTAATCNSVNFRGTAAAINTILRVRLCQDTSGITGTADSCSDDMIDVARKSSKAPIMSVRVRLDEFDKFGSSVVSQGAGLSRCVAMPASRNGEWSLPGDLAMPVGDPANPASAPFRTTFELYPASFDCGATMDAGSTVVTLPSGLASGVGGHKYFGAAAQFIYLNVPDATICSGRTGLDPFAGGTGTLDYPFLLCSVAQLYNVHDGFNASSFRLMTDIDLNPFTKGLSATAPSEWPAAATTCWSEGQNWMPIGQDSACAQIPAGFAGSFYGGGHTITGMRMRLDGPEVGFISKWFPVSNDQSITNLVFVDSEVEGESLVGAVVGNKPAASTVYALIANVEVRGGEVVAGKTGNVSDVGGIVGFSHRTQLRNLKTSRVKVEGEGENIGGIFGHSVGAQTLFQLVSRSYVGGPDWAATVNVGGIGGKLGSDNLIAGQFGEWASESIVVGGQFVGGLLGDWMSTLSVALTDVYSTGSVSIRGQFADFVGGLFGKNFSGAVLTGAYFAGSLLNDNPDQTCGGSCSVGRVSGRAFSMTRTRVYVMTEVVGGQFSLLPRSNFGDDPDGLSGAAPWTVPEITTTAIFTAGTLTGLNTGPWIHLTGDKPRLLSESHPCSAAADSNGISARSALAAQKNFWGSATKPMMICRLDQFTEISSHLSSGKIAVIVGAVNLASSALHAKPDLVAGAYLTGEAGYIHGLRRMETVASLDWAPFNTISGVLKHLVIAGIDLKAVAPITSPSTISGLAVTNSGLVEDVKLVSASLWQDDIDVNVSGLVATNNGVLRDVQAEGSVIGVFGHIAGLVTTNNGTIEDSEAASRLNVNDGGNQVAGVARINSASGIIQRVSMSSKFDSTSYGNFVGDAGMVAITNNGVIRDVHVTSEAYWRARFAANSTSQVAVHHSGVSSSIKRVVVEGFLYDMFDTTSFSAGTLNIVQNLSSANFGSIFAVPAGRLIGEAAPSDITSCTGSTLTFNPGFVFLSSFDSMYWQVNMLGASKLVWLGFDDGNGKVRYTYATDGNLSTNLQIDLGDPCASLGFDGSTRIKVLQDFDVAISNATGDILNSPHVGFEPVAQPYSSTYLTGLDWNANIVGAPVANSVVARGTAGSDWILDIMGEFLTTGTTTTPKPIWEVEADERIELFRIKK